MTTSLQETSCDVQHTANLYIFMMETFFAPSRGGLSVRLHTTTVANHCCGSTYHTLYGSKHTQTYPPLISVPLTILHATTSFYQRTVSTRGLPVDYQRENISLQSIQGKRVERETTDGGLASARPWCTALSILLNCVPHLQRPFPGLFSGSHGEVSERCLERVEDRQLLSIPSDDISQGLGHRLPQCVHPLRDPLTRSIPCVFDQHVLIDKRCREKQWMPREKRYWCLPVPGLVVHRVQNSHQSRG